MLVDGRKHLKAKGTMLLPAFEIVMTELGWYGLESMPDGLGLQGQWGNDEFLFGAVVTLLDDDDGVDVRISVSELSKKDASKLAEQLCNEIMDKVSQLVGVGLGR